MLSTLLQLMVSSFPVCRRQSNVRFHQQSVLSLAPTAASLQKPAQVKALEQLPADWLVYDEMTRTERLALVKCCTLVSPIAVVIFAGRSKLPQDALKTAETNAEGGLPVVLGLPVVFGTLLSSSLLSASPWSSSLDAPSFHTTPSRWLRQTLKVGLVVCCFVELCCYDRCYHRCCRRHLCWTLQAAP